MTYTKTTFADGSGGGTPITAAELNKIGTGIESAALATNGALTLTSTKQGATIGKVSSGASDLNWVNLRPTEGAADGFYGWVAEQVFSGQARNDQIAMFGWNISSGGGRVVTGTRHGALADSYEQYFEDTAGDVSTAQMERHWLYVDPADAQHRPISLAAKLNSPYHTELYLASEVITLSPGKDKNTLAALAIGLTSTVINAASGYNSMTFDDTGGTVVIRSGTAGTPNKCTMQLAADGSFELWSKAAGDIAAGAGGWHVISWDANGATLSGNGGNAQVSVDTNVVTITGPMVYAYGGLRIKGSTATAADPTTTEAPHDKDLIIHKNTSNGAVFLAYNDGGSTIKKVALT